MSTKAQIAAAARAKCQTRDFDLGGGVTISVRELTPNELKALRKRIFATDEKGEIVLFDAAGEEGKPSNADGGWYHIKPGANVVREWLLATMTPAESVDDILSDDVPDSLKDDVYNAARTLNDRTVADAAKNS